MNIGQTPISLTQQFDSRPLKKEPFNKLKNHLEPQSMKALENIVAGNKCQLGTKLAHLESIIRFLVKELGWRADQPSPLNESDEAMELAQSMLECSQSEPDHSDVQNVTRDSNLKPGEFTQLIQETEDFFEKLEKPDKVGKENANNETRDSNHETQNVEDSITPSQAELLREDNNPEKLAPDEAWKPFECSLCDKKLSTKPELDSHIKTHTAKLKPKDVVKEHERKNSEDKPYSCSNCVEKFKTNEHLKVHELTHSGDVQILLDITTPKKHCRECGEKFAVSELEYHEMTHTGATYKKPIEMVRTDNLYKCRKCEQSFKYEKDWVIHEKSHEPAGNKKKFDCPKCNRKFSNLIDLKRHEATHKNKEYQNKETPFFCEKCDKNFKDRFSHSEHTCTTIQERLRLSQTEKLFCCSTCDKDFRRKEDLKKHERTHRIQSKPRSEERGQRRSNDEQFSCEECEMKFNTEEDLKHHEKTHTCPTTKNPDACLALKG